MEAPPPPPLVQSAEDSVVQQQQQQQPPFVHQTVFAKTKPAGFSSFALTVFVISCCNTGAFGVGVQDPPNIVVGLALFHGGLVQLLAGMWDFAKGDTFGATVFTSFGCFWISFGVIFIPGFGITEAYLNAAPHSLNHALGIFLFAWTVLNAMLLVAALRLPKAVVALFISSLITLIFLVLSKYINGVVMQQIAGYTGIVTAILAWYNAFADLLTYENSFFLLPIGKVD